MPISSTKDISFAMVSRAAAFLTQSSRAVANDTVIVLVFGRDTYGRVGLKQ